MSSDVKGGIDYALMKRHYDADDYVVLRDPATGVALINGIPFTATPTYYISGLMAYLADPNVVNPERGWCLFTHGQAAAPVWLAPFLAALGIPWPAAVPAFEAKDTLFYSDQDCWVHFEGRTRVSQFIPANTFFRWKRRWFMIWVERVTADGTLNVWIEG